MNGNDAFQYLSQMSEDERKAVRILWFDEEMLDSLPCVNGDAYNETYTKKCNFFDNLSNEEKGELIERGLYTKGGDYTEKHDEFLDNFAERFEKAIDEKMAEAESDEDEEDSSAKGYEVLEQNYNDVVEKITNASSVLTGDMADLDDETAYSPNPMITFYNGNAITGISFVVNKEERESEEKPWMWWIEGDNTEYHSFERFEDAINDWIGNMKRIDTIIA